MWYAIIAAAFLAVGIGLMIWALRERSARHAAERSADESKSKERAALALASGNAAAAERLHGKFVQLEGQVAAQRDRISELRKLIADKAPMPVIKEWLDQEGEGGEL